jgi:hypothetical protein
MVGFKWAHLQLEVPLNLIASSKKLFNQINFVKCKTLIQFDLTQHELLMKNLMEKCFSKQRRRNRLSSEVPRKHWRPHSRDFGSSREERRT